MKHVGRLSRETAHVFFQRQGEPIGAQPAFGGQNLIGALGLLPKMDRQPIGVGSEWWMSAPFGIG